MWNYWLSPMFMYIMYKMDGQKKYIIEKDVNYIQVESPYTQLPLSQPQSSNTQRHGKMRDQDKWKRKGTKLNKSIGSIQWKIPSYTRICDWLIYGQYYNHEFWGQ